MTTPQPWRGGPMIPRAVPTIFNAVDLAIQRLRQDPGYRADLLYRDLPRRLCRHLMRRVDRAMTPEWSADETPPRRFARFAALPERLRREAGRVAAFLPDPPPASPIEARPVYVPPARKRSRAERFPRIFAGR